MTIKLKGSTDGSVSLQAPVDTSPTGTDITLTLPTTAGSANQFVKNSGTAGTLEYSSMIEDSSGRLLHGTSSASTGAFGTVPFFHSASTNAANIFQNFGNTTFPARIDLCKTRGTSANNHTVLQNNDTVGGIFFAGSDGTDYAQAAQIEAFVDGTPGNNDMPGRLVFATTADGNEYATERMRITKDGALYVGETSGGTTAHDNGRGCVKARGYNTRQGVNNSLRNNVFNIDWTSPNVQVWIDTTNIGTIAQASDYRVKDNIVSITSNCIDRVKQLRPVQFEYANYGVFSADGVTREGFIAHEVAEVIPSGVEGEKDDPNQIQSLKLDAILGVTVKALQEAVAKIETLEAKVAALEAGS